MRLLISSLATACLLLIVHAQEYAQDYNDYSNDYSQDNLYADYAQKQAEKVNGGGSGIGKMALGAAAGWFVGGKVHSGRVSKKLKKKHLKEQKNLYTQYYNDVYKLQEENAQLLTAIEQMQAQSEQEALLRDYEEFKQPDIDGDDRISRAEFNMYVKNYLANYPGLSDKDYPKFEDFDHDRDGYVSFTEYAQQMALQVQQAEWDNYYKEQAGQSVNKQQQKGLQGLYKETTKTDSFKDLYANLKR